MIFQDEVVIGGKSLRIQSGKLAKQAHGAVLVEMGETTVFVSVCRAKGPEGIDFFPLSVEYRERTNASGRFPGGFIKREGRPSEKEILTSRLVDRPIRPLFPENYHEEVQIIVQVFSADHEQDPDILAMIGASAALSISPVPFEGPIGSVRMGLLKDRLVVNPTYEEREQSQLDLIVAADKDGVVMVEAGAKEVTEDVMMEAIKMACQEIKKIIALQEKMVSLLKPVKIQVPALDLTFYQSVKAEVYREVSQRLRRQKKEDRLTAVSEYHDQLKAKYCSKVAPVTTELILNDVIDRVKKQVLQDLAFKEKIRVDGRHFDELRDISCEIGLFKRPHGSAVFTRGETQALVLTTLGTSRDEQKIESIASDLSKRFMLHYNFPPFSVGEVRPLRGVGRREIGHGALAERALFAVLPSIAKFPYTIGITSDIMESNGSSSMATVCGATLSLMDAGVPLRQPVAGIALGLISEGDRFQVVSDINDMEDHFGGMDFKVAGSQIGITAVQMDIKVKRIPFKVLADAFEQGRQGRLKILKKILETINRPREEISIYAPRIFSVKIDPKDIGSLIGPGGKVIKGIQEETGSEIEIQEDGTVLVFCKYADGAKKAKAMIERITEKVVIGKNYVGRVTATKNFGAFVEIIPGQEGLIHVSELDVGYVENVTDIVRVGDKVEVRILGIDEQNRIKLSRKACIEESQNNGKTEA
ncbi:MAG: polyribonucleotide nucleotidyltransferase [Planctomycetota bacterium]